MRGALYGALIGDALGVPYEFSSPEELPAVHLLEMRPPPGFDRAHRRVPPGTWSDDGALLLVLLESLLEKPHFELEHFTRGMLAWFERGHMTPDGVVFDIGLQTRRGLQNFAHGIPAERCGPDGASDNGNGALMRTLPCALVPIGTKARLIELARRQGLPTHGHVRSQLCCALYALVAHDILRGRAAGDAMWAAIDTLEAETAPCHQSELRIVLDGLLEPSRGSGYVVDSLSSALRCVLSTDGYEACVKAAISLGNDTDTTACIAGGLAGALYGEDAIPERWREALQGRAIVEGLLARLGVPSQ